LIEERMFLEHPARYIFLYGLLEISQARRAIILEVRLQLLASNVGTIARSAASKMQFLLAFPPGRMSILKRFPLRA
jgi:hypothetical protein